MLPPAWGCSSASRPPHGYFTEVQHAYRATMDEPSPRAWYRASQRASSLAFWRFCSHGGKGPAESVCGVFSQSGSGQAAVECTVAGPRSPYELSIADNGVTAAVGADILIKMKTRISVVIGGQARWIPRSAATREQAAGSVTHVLFAPYFQGFLIDKHGATEIRGRVSPSAPAQFALFLGMFALALLASGLALTRGVVASTVIVYGPLALLAIALGLGAVACRGGARGNALIAESVERAFVAHRLTRHAADGADDLGRRG